jgi:hypothetical protein
MRGVLARTLLVLLLLAAAPSAWAMALGPRIGYTDDEDFNQIHIGFHMELAEPIIGVKFNPNLEVGFGDDVTLLAFNGDFLYTFPELATNDWSFYAGGGLALNIAKVDKGDDHKDLGLNAVGGIVRKLEGGSDVFLELRLGLEDSPGFKITTGLIFF